MCAWNWTTIDSRTMPNVQFVVLSFNPRQMMRRFTFDKLVFLAIAAISTVLVAGQLFARAAVVGEFGDGSWMVDYQVASDVIWFMHETDDSIWMSVSSGCEDDQDFSDVRIAIWNKTDRFLIGPFSLTTSFWCLDYNAGGLGKHKSHWFEVNLHDSISGLPPESAQQLILAPHSTAIVQFDVYDINIHWTTHRLSQLVPGDPFSKLVQPESLSIILSQPQQNPFQDWHLTYSKPLDW